MLSRFFDQHVAQYTDVLQLNIHDNPKPPTDVPWLSSLTLLRELRFLRGLGTLPEDMGRLSALRKGAIPLFTCLLTQSLIVLNSHTLRAQFRHTIRSGIFDLRPLTLFAFLLVPASLQPKQDLPISIQRMARGLKARQS